MTTHMTQSPANALFDFITELVMYVSSSQKNNSYDTDEDHDSECLFDVSIFNEYFSRQENKEQINKFTKIYGLKP